MFIPRLQCTVSVFLIEIDELQLLIKKVFVSFFRAPKQPSIFCSSEGRERGNSFFFTTVSFGLKTFKISTNCVHFTPLIMSASLGRKN